MAMTAHERAASAGQPACMARRARRAAAQDAKRALPHHALPG